MDHDILEITQSYAPKGRSYGYSVNWCLPTISATAATIGITPQLSANSLTPLAKRLVATENPLEIYELREEIIRAFYGDTPDA